MPNATSLSYFYRKQKGFDRYFKGVGIDIGCGSDCLSRDHFPSIERVDPYDMQHGDANTCSNIPDNTYDFVYSSHCLEHMHDPYVTFGHWLRICKPGGYQIHAVPHEIFYEKFHWPSLYNSDHKTSWTLEWRSNLPKTVHVPDFLNKFNDQFRVISAETILENYNFGRFTEDQTLGNTICHIEFIGQKK